MNSCCHGHTLGAGGGIRVGWIPVGVEGDRAGGGPVARVSAPANRIGVSRRENVVILAMVALCGGDIQGGGVGAMKHGFVGQGMDAFVERGAAEQMGGVVGVVGRLDGEADDLAAVEVEDQVEMEPLSDDGSRQMGHVPAPDMARSRRPMRCRGLWRCRRGMRATAMAELVMRAQHAVEA